MTRAGNPTWAYNGQYEQGCPKCRSTSRLTYRSNPRYGRSFTMFCRICGWERYLWVHPVGEYPIDCR